MLFPTHTVGEARCCHDSDCVITPLLFLFLSVPYMLLYVFRLLWVDPGYVWPLFSLVF